jgi:hypothetical protein
MSHGALNVVPGPQIRKSGDRGSRYRIPDALLAAGLAADAICIAPSVGYGRQEDHLSGTHSQFHDLSALQEPSSFEDRRHRLLDPRGPRLRLLRAGEVKQISPLPAWRQRFERALEPRIVSELLL